MNYKHLDEKKRAQLDILYECKCSMREIGRRLNISYSTVSRYLNMIHKPRLIPDIHVKYKDFIEYLIERYDWRVNSIEACV